MSMEWVARVIRIDPMEPHIDYLGDHITRGNFIRVPELSSIGGL